MYKSENRANIEHTQVIPGYTTGGKDDEGEFTSPVDQ
jgi:hypothetical protein